MYPEEVCVVIPTSESEEEIFNSNVGHKKLIYLQYKFLKNNNYKIHILPILKLEGYYPKILKYLKESGKRYEKINVNKATNLINDFHYLLLISLRILLYVSQLLDHQFISSLNLKIKDYSKNYSHTVILNNLGEINSGILLKKWKKILICHDVQSKVYSSFIVSKLIKSPVLLLSKFLEIMQVKNNNIIITLNQSDKNFFQKYHDTVVIWAPFIFQNFDEVKLTEEKKFIIGFLGSNWKFNILASKRIIEIAIKLTEYPQFEFWILGSVGYSIQKEKVPKNVVITGWVDDIDKFLKNCDIFLNPKEGVTSGLEIKALDYLNYNKPIITTSYGAIGLPLSNNSSIIDNDFSKWPDYILYLFKNPKIFEKMKNNLIEEKIDFQRKMLTTINKILCE